MNHKNLQEIEASLRMQEEGEHLPAAVRALTRSEREQLEQALDQSISNAVSHCKRSLLDYLDYMKRLAETMKPEIREPFFVTIESMKRRVHNDVSMIKDTVDAAHRIYRSGGKIPPFGRPEEARPHAARLHPQRP